MAEQTMIHMFAQSAGDTQDSIAVIDIPEDGVIMGVDWAVNADLDADAESTFWQLSFIATNQSGINDARGVISHVSARIALVTSGIAMVAINRYIPMELAVAGGERIHLHSIGSSGVVANCRCILHFEGRRPIRRRSQRRR